MCAMVMCPENAPSAGLYQRYPSPPVNYPTAFNGFGYGTPGTQHPQDYQQFSTVSDPTVHQAWYNAMYGARTDDWGYGATTATSALTSTPTAMGTYSYRPANTGLDYSQNPGPMAPSDSPGDSSSASSTSGSPTNKQLRPPYDWMKKAAYQSAPVSGKTRTKDKYRVVYSDHQRLELEKEFHYSRYITIRRKAELAQALALSERQVKIWFQNRRAKERKINKKREDPSAMKISTDMTDFQEETKHNVQQHMNMQMPAHAQHQIPCQSPTSPHIIAQHPGYSPYGQEHHVQHGMHQVQSNLSPQGHMTMHGQYQTNTHMQLPISPMPGQGSISPNTCSVSPVNIKTDIDANESLSS